MGQIIEQLEQEKIKNYGISSIWLDEANDSDYISHLCVDSRKKKCVMASVFILSFAKVTDTGTMTGYLESESLTTVF